METLISPTGLGPRGEDPHGSGAFLAKRSGRPHYGTDFISVPGRPVVAPCDGFVIRRKRPYSDDPLWDGLLMQTHDGHLITMFYLSVPRTILGVEVTSGQTLGEAQDLERRYPGITPHVHMEVEWSFGHRLPDEWQVGKDYIVKQGKIFVNPLVLIGG